MSAVSRSIASVAYDRLWFGMGATAASVSFVGLHHMLGSGATLGLYVAFNALYNLPHQYCTWFRALTDSGGGGGGSRGSC